jgi:HPt (histidine-containing phosphotransfer) domain-containing protein
VDSDSSTVDTEPPPLDGVALERLLSLGGEPFLRQMIDIVLPQVETRLEAARDGLAAGDLAAVRLAAHSLRSTAGNVGATRMMAAAHQLEDLAEEAKAAEAAAAFAVLAGAWAPVRSGLEARRRELPE